MAFTRKKWTKRDMLLLGATALITILTLMHNAAGQAPDAVARLPRAGYVAPALDVVALDGGVVRLQDYQGKKIFLNFWASWCPPCNQEMPDIVKLSNRYRDQVVFLGVNLTSGDREQGVRSFVNKYAVHFPTLLDRDGQAAASYQVLAVPTTFLIDQHGKVLERHDGPLSSEQMEALLHELIEVP